MKKFLFFALLSILSCSKDESSIDCIYQHALETSEATNITDTSAILNGSIVVTSDNCNITPGAQKGFVYSTNNQPNTNDNLITSSGEQINVTLTKINMDTNELNLNGLIMKTIQVFLN